MNRFLFQALMLALLCGNLSTTAAPSRCEVCRRRLKQHYLTYKDAACCSEQCVDQLRPRCSVCNCMIDGNFVQAEGKSFCSQECFATTLPKCEHCNRPIRTGYTITRHQFCAQCVNEAPRCFSCGLPARHPTRLADGRTICNACMRWSVKQQDQAQLHYARARRQLEAWTGLKIQSVPPLELVDRNRMRTLSKNIRKSDSAVTVRGLYSRQTYLSKRGLFGQWKKDDALDEETIYIVDHLHDQVFRTAAVHELMHDLIHEHFPRLKEAPLWVHEGICQQAAAEYCRRRNYADILYGIENCTDPDYGNGYRYIKKLSGFRGWRALQQWMETVEVNTLPKQAPH